jgi:ribonuclease HI
MRRYMTFCLPPATDDPTGAPRYFRCAALPFGWLNSPYVFTKVMRVMVRMLRSPTAPSLERLRRSAASGKALVLRLARRGGVSLARGFKILGYVDDFLAVFKTRREALAGRDRCQEVMDYLGIQRHPDKGEWEPTQHLEHLGLDIDFKHGLFKVPPRKLVELMRQARDVAGLATREARLVPARLLAGFIGYAQSVALACPQARFYLRSLHDSLSTRTSWDGRVRLSKQALRDLAWWRHIDRADVARAIWQEPEQATLHTDASKLAWGAVLNNTVPAHGFWRPRDRANHITYLELLAVHRALQTFLARLQGKSTLLWCDNQSVVHVLTNRTTRSPEMMALLRRCWYLIDKAGIDLRVRWISTHENDYADYLSRGSPYDHLALNDRAWARLEQRFGPHTIDRYASAGNARLPRFNTEVPHPASQGAPALAQDWHLENNFAFPPVSELPALAQLLEAQPQLQATVVAPHWPAAVWTQQLMAVASYAELWLAAQVCQPPSGLHTSAQHVLSGATLAFYRIEARRDGR